MSKFLHDADAKGITIPQYAGFSLKTATLKMGAKKLTL